MQQGQFPFKFCSKDMAILASTMYSLGSNATMQGFQPAQNFWED